MLEKGNDKVFYDLLKDCSQRFGLNQDFTFDEMMQVYGMKIFDIVHWFNPELEENYFRSNILPYLKENTFKYAKKNIQAQDSSEKVLSEIIERGHQNIVVSNASQEVIEKFVSLVRLENYFQQIIGVGGFKYSGNGEFSKADAVRKNFDLGLFEKTIFIGDHPSDMKAGRELGSTTYLFSKRIEECENADYIIQDLNVIITRELGTVHDKQ